MAKIVAISGLDGCNCNGVGVAPGKGAGWLLVTVLAGAIFVFTLKQKGKG